MEVLTWQPTADPLPQTRSFVHKLKTASVDTKRSLSACLLWRRANAWPVHPPSATPLSPRLSPCIQMKLASIPSAAQKHSLVVSFLHVALSVGKDQVAQLHGVIAVAMCVLLMSPSSGCSGT